MIRQWQSMHIPDWLIYDILKSGAKYNEAEYEQALNEMVQACLDYEFSDNPEKAAEPWEKAEAYNDLYDDFVMPVQQPVVKENLSQWSMSVRQWEKV